MNEKDIIKKQNNLEELSYEEIKYMVNMYVKHKINDSLMSKFIMNIYNNGLSKQETFDLTDVMINSGETINLSKITKPIVDKHSSGGIGDKTTLLVAPIVASLGVCVPKMSGRGLGITGGTVDKLESIPGYKLNLSEKEFIKSLNNIGCAVVSQSEEVAVADKKIYALRNEIGAVDSIPLIASSIMSKKIASGANNIVIDLKVGSGAFMKDIKSATALSKTMIDIGNYYKRKVVCVLTDMSTPLGRNIGNALEVKEVIDFFDGKYDKRLYNLVVYLSSQMVKISKGITYRRAKNQVIDSINIGLAKEKFYEWIKNQKGNIKKFDIDAKKHLVIAKEDGYVNGIEASILGELVFKLGAGRKKKTDKIDYNVGFMINKQLGSKVKKGEILGVIFYNDKVDKMETIARSAFIINKYKKRVHNIIIKTID